MRTQKVAGRPSRASTDNTKLPSQAIVRRDVPVAAFPSLRGGAARHLGLPAESACPGDLPGPPYRRGGASAGGRPVISSQFSSHAMTSKEQL
jgi:hypothetical protein